MQSMVWGMGPGGRTGALPDGAHGLSALADPLPVWPRRMSFSVELASFERAVLALGRFSSQALTPRAEGLFVRAAIVEAMNADARHAEGEAARALGLRDVLVAEALPEGARMPSARLHLALNTIRAADIGLAAVRSQGRAAFTPELFQAMHVSLCAGLAVRGTPGGLRGDVLTALCRRLAEPAALAHENAGHAPPLVARMGYAAAAFADLAPFRYGNEMIARLIAGLVAVAEGMPPVIVGFVPVRREMVSPPGPATPICTYFETLAVAARRAEDISAALLDLHAGWVRRMATLRSDSNARRLIDHGFDAPVLSVARAESLLDVTFQTANAAVATLVSHGILVSHGGQRRNRIFVMQEVLNLIDPAPTSSVAFAPLPVRPDAISALIGADA